MHFKCPAVGERMPTTWPEQERIVATHQKLTVWQALFLTQHPMLSLHQNQQHLVHNATQVYLEIGSYLNLIREDNTPVKDSSSMTHSIHMHCSTVTTCCNPCAWQREGCQFQSMLQNAFSPHMKIMTLHRNHARNYM